MPGVGTQQWDWLHRESRAVTPVVVDWSCCKQLELVVIVTSMPSALSAAADSPVAAETPAVGMVVVKGVSLQFSMLDGSPVVITGPKQLPESVQNGSPTVIVGPKLLALLSLIGLSTTRVSRRLDSGSPLEGRTTASANVSSISSTPGVGSDKRDLHARCKFHFKQPIPSLELHPAWAPTSGTSTLECIHKGTERWW